MNKIIFILVLTAIVLFSGCIGETDLIRGNEFVFYIEINNTNLAPTVAGEMNGTGERVAGTTYYANETPIELFVWGHAQSVGATAELHLFINGTKVADTSGRPIGVAEQSNKTITAIIPRYASYMIEATNTHHYEWREYRIISGQNGSISIINNYASAFNGTLVYDQSELNMTNGLNYMYGGAYIIEHSPGSMVGFSTNVDMQGNDITGCGNCVNTTIYKTNSIYSADGNIYLFKNGTITTGAIEYLIEAGATNNTTLEINGDYTISRSINISNVSNARIDCRSCNLYLADNVNYSVFIFTDVNDSTISNFHIELSCC